jgi:SAM-dependent methyltransferase
MKDLGRLKAFWKDNLESNFFLMYGEELFFPNLLKIAEKSPNILEIGVGKGRMVSILKSNGIKNKFYGLDITESLKNADVVKIVGDCRILPIKNNSFDLVYSLGVVEHFPETKQAIIHHAGAVRRGGYVLITVPALGIFTPLRYLVYILRDIKKGTFMEIRGRNLRLKAMKKYFNQASLDIMDFGYFGIFGIGAKLRKFCKNDNLIKKIQKNFGAYLFIIGRKR